MKEGSESEGSEWNKNKMEEVAVEVQQEQEEPAVGRYIENSMLCHTKRGVCVENEWFYLWSEFNLRFENLNCF